MLEREECWVIPVVVPKSAMGKIRQCMFCGCLDDECVRMQCKNKCTFL